MIDVANGIQVNYTQQMRVAEHPIRIKSDSCLMIVDNLEGGYLRIYEHYGDSVNIQQLLTGNSGYHELLVEAIVNSLWKNDGVFIHKIICEYGQTAFILPILSQILHFADFYNYQYVGISDREYEKWLPYGREILSGFKKVNRVYEYCV